jgi:RNA polymerase primary sigma factor
MRGSAAENFLWQHEPLPEGGVEDSLAYDDNLVDLDEFRALKYAEALESEPELIDLDLDIGDPLQSSITTRILIRSEEVGLLTASEEIELAKRIEKGDLAAKERLIEANYRWIIAIAHNSIYRQYGLSMEELVQEGVIGLMRAAEKFDYRKGFKFSTYSTFWIKRQLQASVEDKSRSIRMPAIVYRESLRVVAINGKLLKELQRYPTLEEIAERAELSVPEVIEYLDLWYKQQPLSLEKSIDGEDDGMTLGETIVNPEPEEIDGDLQNTIRGRSLIEAINKLPGIRAQVIQLYYGIGEKDGGMERDGVGHYLGVRGETVTKRHTEALRMLAKDEQLQQRLEEIDSYKKKLRKTPR